MSSVLIDLVVIVGLACEIYVMMSVYLSGHRMWCELVSEV